MTTITRPNRFRQEKNSSPDEGPINPEAERIVLATILADNRALERLSDRLTESDFACPLHRQIFAASARLVATGRRAEPATILSELTAAVPLADMTVGDYLDKLRWNGRLSSDLPGYAETVANAAVARKIRTLCSSYDGLAKTGSAGLVERLSRDVTALTGNVSAATYQPGAVGIDGVMAEIRARRARGGGISGLSTGFPRLDRMIDGLRPATLTIIGARPKQGKTALALAFLRNLSLKGTPVVFFSLEMPKEQIDLRLIALHAGVSFEQLVRGELGEADMAKAEQAATDVKSWPHHIDDAGGLTLSALSLRARHAVKIDGAKVVIIDYLQRLRPERQSSRYEAVTEISMGVADLRKTLDVPIVAMAQLNRKVADRASEIDFAKFRAEASRPTDADLRDSGQIEQDGDAILFINRPEVLLEKLKPADGNVEREVDWNAAVSKWRGKAELSLHYNRSGATGIVQLNFNGPQMRFEEPAF